MYTTSFLDYFLHGPLISDTAELREQMNVRKIQELVKPDPMPVCVLIDLFINQSCS